MKRPMTSPTAPTIIRIRPAAWMLMPATVAVTAYFRIAPTAMRNIDVPIVIRPSFPWRFGANGSPWNPPSQQAAERAQVEVQVLLGKPELFAQLFEPPVQLHE